MWNARTRIALIVISAAIAIPTVSRAQASRTGPTFMIGGGTSPVILPDVAYDPLTGRYLVVSGNGFIEGQLLGANGAKIAGFVVTAGSLAGGYAQTPRVAYGPGVNGGNGGYLVTWHETVGPVAQVRGKLINADGNALTGEIVIATEAGAPGTGSNWTMGAAVAYSTGSHEFLVAWMGGYFSTQDIRFNRVNTAGQVLQAPAAITGGADWERDPSVAYNPHQNEFYIAYAGYLDAGGFGYVNGQRVQAGSGGLIGGPTMFIQSLATMIPNVEYNSATGQYVVAWYNRSSGSAAFYGVSVSGATGGIIGGVRLMSSYYVAYDGLDLSYNPGSGDFLLVTHGNGSQNWEDAAVAIRADGTPFDNGFILTQTAEVRPLRSNPSATEGNFNPRVVANAGGQYLTVTSSNFAAIHGQFAAGAGGGPAPPPPPPPPSAPNTHMNLDIPVTGSEAAGRVTVAGWAIDLHAPSGCGVDAVHVYAYPVTGAAPIFLGQAAVMTRPDVGAAFGQRFANGGFMMSAALPPGTYDVAAFAHSTVSGTFTAVRASRVTVIRPPSEPRMSVDQPVSHQDVTRWPGSFTIAGWALDLSSTSDPGVDGVHVWAFPVAGGSPFWLGAATLGIPRSDVEAAFGGAQFRMSGFHLTAAIPDHVPPGAYDLVVWAHSAIAGTFNNWKVARITVR
jgi:hypothetical protein